MPGLCFVGLGLGGSKGLSIEGLETLKTCDIIYLEQYTTPGCPSIEDMEELLDKKVVLASREFLEDGRIIINESKDKLVGLLIAGDPMVATTHSELRIRVQKEGGETRIIHGSSIISSIAGETGLQAYRFGKSVTVTDSPPSSLATVYETVQKNLLQGLHTLIFFEWIEGQKLLEPKVALSRLIESEADFRLGIFNPELFVVIVARLGQATQLMRSGKLSIMKDEDYGEPPFSLVIPGKLHFTEKDALEAFAGLDEATFQDNTELVRSRARIIVPTYIKNTRAAIQKVRKNLDSDSKANITHFADLMENVECYTSDSERFLNEGKEELAILSIGYAEGLLDALRFMGLIESPW
mgnify:CR=1 FL=1